jgi:hypothetical protein
VKDTRQLIGSLLVALAIVTITIVVVTSKLGNHTGQRDDRHGGRTEQER